MSQCVKCERELAEDEVAADMTVRGIDTDGVTTVEKTLPVCEACLPAVVESLRPMAEVADVITVAYETDNAPIARSSSLPQSSEATDRAE